jgi:uncharacterized surface protein with fasciclin (FAS1) repeats
MRKLILYPLLAILLVLPLVPSAVAYDSDYPSTVPQQTSETFFLRAGHFAMVAPAVDVFTNDERIIGELPFLELTDWLELPAGSYEFRLVISDSNDEVAVDPIALEAAAGSRATLVATGSADAETLSFQVFTGEDEPLAPGLSRVTFLHAMPEVPPLEIQIDEEVVLSDLAYNDLASLDVESGVVDLRLVAREEDRVVAALGQIATPLQAETTVFVAAVALEDDAPVLVIESTELDIGAEVSALETEPGNTLLNLLISRKYGDFNIFLSALEVTGMTEDLRGEGPLTLFVPTDEAFNARPDLLETILADPDLLQEVLNYHIYEGGLTEADAVFEDTLTMRNGAPLTIELTPDSELLLNGIAQLTVANIRAENGVLHIIDTLLLPPDTVP